MSIINRMLKDLEQKPENDNLSPIYQPKSARLPVWYWFVLVLFPLVLWVWWPQVQLWWHPRPAESVVAHPQPIAAKPSPAVTEAVVAHPEPLKTDIAAPAPVSNVSAAETSAAVIPANVPAPVVASSKPAVPAPDQPLEAKPTTKEAETSTVTAPTHQETDDDAGYDNAIVEMPAPQPEMHVQEEKLSAGEIASLERRKYQIAMAKRDTDAAKQSLLVVLANDPLDIQSRKQLAALYYGENALDAARDTLNDGIRYSPTNADLRLLAARVLQAQGQTSEALQTLKAIMPSAQRNLDFYALRAALAQQVGDLSDAERSYRALLQAEPMAGRWWLGLAISQDKNGELAAISTASYRRALLDKTLSAASRHFAEQRIQQLMEHR